MNKLFFVFLLLSYVDLTAQSEERSGSPEMPLDDIVHRQILKERKPLAEAPVKESDIFWEKRIWRILDIREKKNQVFSYPVRPFFSIVEEAANAEMITLYSTEDESFRISLSQAEIKEILYRKDTIELIDPVTLEVRWQVVENRINQEDIKRYRIKEVWFFDSCAGQLRVKILGIAPLIEVFDANGNFRFEKPLFWVYFPELRQVLAHESVFSEGNDRNPMSWDDLFMMRFFSSTIYKSSNIQDVRISENYAGIDAMLEADKINQELFNFEHDLWSY